MAPSKSSTRPRPSLTPAGRTSNTSYSTAAADILVVQPDEGLRDDGDSARENMAFQTEYARSLGRPIAVIVLLSSLKGQDAEARRVYAEGMDTTLFYASALVVGNALARAIGSFFLGLSKPATPTDLFDRIERAIAWAESHRPPSEPPS